MFTDETKEYYKENYEKKNRKKGRGLNIPERLYRDYHKCCIDEGKSMSEEIRLFMTEKVKENKK